MLESNEAGGGRHRVSLKRWQKVNAKHNSLTTLAKNFVFEVNAPETVEAEFAMA